MSLEKIRDLIDDFIPCEQWNNDVLYDCVLDIIKDATEQLYEDNELTSENLKEVLEDLIGDMAEFQDAEYIVANYGIRDAVNAYHIVHGRVNYLNGSLTVEQLAYAVIYINVPPVDEIIEAFKEGGVTL